MTNIFMSLPNDVLITISFLALMVWIGVFFIPHAGSASLKE